MQNIYIFSVAFILAINFKINYVHGASFNFSNVNYYENQLQRTIRQTNVEECVPPTIPNGNVLILRQRSRKTRHFLSLNITCNNNYILQPPNDYLMSCFNGFWDVEEPPQCKKCIKISENTEIDDNTDLQLICPESLNDNSIFPDCGQRYDSTHQPFVVNGSLAKFAEFPWHVGIYKKDQSDSHPLYHCGGSIITEKTILTVAHCFSDAIGNIIRTRQYYAAAGKYHRTYNSDIQIAQNRKVVRTDLHPRYKGELTNFAWDIAVVLVDEPFEISTIIHPVCIDWKTNFESEHLSPDVYGEVAGWGKTELDFNTPASELRVLKVPFINVEQCNKFVPSTFIRYITHDKFCAGYMNGSSVCDGDSGGGLVFVKQHKGKTKYYIRGLVSVGLQDDGKCDSYKYSTYTKVSEYIPFIRECIQNKDIPVTTTIRPFPTSSRPVFPSTTSLPEIIQNATEETVYCKTPNDETAKCISIFDCKTFADVLRSPSEDVIKFIKASVCGKPMEKKVCCGSVANYLSVIQSNPVTVKPVEHRNLNLLPEPGVCGKQINGREGKIIRGIAADLLDYPWMALLEFGTPEKSAGFLCAGFLINEKYVVTAAHCAIKTRVADLGQVFRVRLGEYNTETKIDCERFGSEEFCAAPPLDVNIEEIIVHPMYQRSTYMNDIALLRLARNISYTDFIRPICLPLHGEKSLPGKKFTVAGWGQTEIGARSPIKLKTVLYAVSQEECANKFKKYTKIVDSHVCAINVEGTGECKGDTGGPLMSKLTNSSYFYAEGVMSFGTKQCADNVNPSVATRVTEYIDWILDAIKP